MNKHPIVLSVFNCFKCLMSTEKLINTERQNFSSLAIPKIEEKKLSARVDINDLLARVREVRKKENKLNLVFFGLFASLILVVGTILSF